MAREYLVGSGEGVRISLRVSPDAKNSGIKGLYGDRMVKLSVTLPPEKGKANAEVEGLLAEVFGVGVSAVEVVRGASGRDKVALVRGVSLERALGALDGALGGKDGYGG